MHALRIVLIVVTLAITAGTSRADWSYGNVPNPYATQLYYDAFGHGRRNAKDSTPAAVAHRPLKETDFKRAKGRPVLDEFMASTGLTGSDADQLRADIESMIASLEGFARKDNVAAAMSVLFTTAYRVVNNINVSDGSRDAVIAALNDALAVQPSFKKLSAKERQNIADTALVQAVLIAAMSERPDEAARAVGINGARSALRYLTGSEDGNKAANLTLDYGNVID